MYVKMPTSRRPVCEDAWEMLVLWETDGEQLTDARANVHKEPKDTTRSSHLLVLSVMVRH